MQGPDIKRHCKVLGDNVSTHKYVGGLGNLPNRNCPGVSKSAATKKHLRKLWQYSMPMFMRWKNFSSAMAIHMQLTWCTIKATKLFDWKTIDGCHIFSTLALGTNKYLEAQQDKDYCYSLVTVFKRKAAILQDKPVAYFYFLRLGTVVPLRSGDVLIFNPREL